MKRILIIKPSSLGDVVHAFPAVHALLAASPDLTVDWVIHPAFAELLDYLPGVRRRILFRRQELGRPASFFPALRELLHTLRGESYDAVIDLQGLFRSALVGMLAHGCLYGPAAAREWPARFCYRRRLHYPSRLHHAVEKNCAMIQDFSGLSSISTEYHLPVVSGHAQTASRLLAESGLKNGAAFLAVAPGARWKTKQWPPEFFAAWAEQIVLRRPDAVFVLLGSPAEADLCRRTADAVRGVRMVNLCGRTTLGVLTEIIRCAEVLLCNDSGPMHLAAAVGTPTAALFGPTDPEQTGPYGVDCRVIRPELPCIGCLRKQCETEKCHGSVSPQQAAGRVLELLKQGEERKE